MIDDFSQQQTKRKRDSDGYDFAAFDAENTDVNDLLGQEGLLDDDPLAMNKRQRRESVTDAAAADLLTFDDDE